MQAHLDLLASQIQRVVGFFSFFTNGRFVATRNRLSLLGHFSNSASSFHVFVSRFGNSHHISNFLIVTVFAG